MTVLAEAKILRRTFLRRERVLPIPGEVLVKAGDTVRPDTVVAKTEILPGDPYIIDLKSGFRAWLTAQQVGKAMLKRVGDHVKAGEVLAQLQRGVLGEVSQITSPVEGTVEFISRAYGRVLVREDPKSALPIAVVPVARQLDVWPSMIRMYLRVREGDEIKMGMVLADCPGVGGLDYSYAPISGIVEKIDSRTGTLTIVRPARPTLVDAYLSGRVESVIPEHGAVVTCHAAFAQGVLGVGFETYGYLRFAATGPESLVEARDLPGELRDQVIVAGRRITLEAVRKAAAGGARGIISGGMHHYDLAQFVGAEIGVGITGQEDVPLTVILTEGFGEMPMATWTYDLLREHEGQLASLNGSTQVRAGVIRPEIVIPVDGGAPGGGDETAFGRTALGPGARVRVLRKPYFGMWGAVVEVPAEPVKVETEAVLPVVRVRLQDGSEVIVPQANVELF